jgi:hypothetical protein
MPAGDPRLRRASSCPGRHASDTTSHDPCANDNESAGPHSTVREFRQWQARSIIRRCPERMVLPRCRNSSGTLECITETEYPMTTPTWTRRWTTSACGARSRRCLRAVRPSSGWAGAAGASRAWPGAPRRGTGILQVRRFALPSMACRAYLAAHRRQSYRGFTRLDQAQSEDAPCQPGEKLAGRVRPVQVPVTPWPTDTRSLHSPYVGVAGRHVSP